MEINGVDILVICIITILFIVSLIVIRRNKGKCASCTRSDTCPFKKDKDVK